MSGTTLRGTGFLILAVLVIGLMAGLITGAFCTGDPRGVTAGLRRASRCLAAFSLLLAAGLAALTHSPEHAVRAYAASLVSLGLAALCTRLVVKDVTQAAPPPQSSTEP